MSHKKQGAGVLIQARDTGRVLLARRSDAVPSPGHWAFFGGSVDAGETPLEAAKRELREEGGLVVDIDEQPIHIRKDNSNFTFYSFLGHVDHEIEPVLNAESSAFGWFDIDNPPKNLLNGVLTTLVLAQITKED